MNWPQRKRAHYRAARNGHHGNPRFAADLLKYGEAMEWSVLAVVEEDMADEVETKAIALFRALSPAGYNLTEGGEGGRKSARTLANMREAARRSWADPVKRARRVASMRPWNKGKTLPPEFGAAVAAAMQGRPAWNKGIPHTPETKAKMRGRTPWNKGIPQTPEVKAKLREAAIRQFADPANRAKAREATLRFLARAKEA